MIKERVINVLVEQLAVKKEDITDQANLVNDLGADELDSVEIVMCLEETFGIEIPDEDAEKFIIVKDIVEYIEKKKMK